jgi:hypothetical protein
MDIVFSQPGLAAQSKIARGVSQKLLFASLELVAAGAGEGAIGPPGPLFAFLLSLRESPRVAPGARSGALAARDGLDTWSVASRCS